MTMKVLGELEIDARLRFCRCSPMLHLGSMSMQMKTSVLPESKGETTSVERWQSGCRGENQDQRGKQPPNSKKAPSCRGLK